MACLLSFYTVSHYANWSSWDDDDKVAGAVLDNIAMDQPYNNLLFSTRVFVVASTDNN